MTIMALPVLNKGNIFPQGLLDDMNFSYKEGNSWIPVFDTSSIKLSISKQSSFPSKTLSGGKIFLFNDYEIGKKLISLGASLMLGRWKDRPNLKPSPLCSINYYGASNPKRPFDGYNFITTDGILGYTISNHPTFNGYDSETGYGIISVNDYNQYCSNKTSTWLNPVMEIAPKIIQSYSLPVIDVDMGFTGSWKILWRSFNIGAGTNKCALMSLIYHGEYIGYNTYCDIIYPYEKLLGVFLEDNYYNNSEVTLII